MASESLERTLQVGGVATVVETAPIHDPAPRLELVERPDMGGAAALVKTGPDTWEVVNFDGPQESVARHCFRSIRGFVRWLGRWADPKSTQVFADLASPLPGNHPPSMTARLDPADPRGDLVVCEVPFDPGFRAWVIATHGKRFDQRALFSLVRGHGQAIVGENAAESLLGTLAALRVVGTMNLESELAPNGRTIVSGMKGGIEVSRELPGEITLRTPVYAGVRWAIGDEGPEADYALRAVLDVEVGQNGLAVAITFPDLDRIMMQAGEDLVEHVELELGEGWLVCIGSERSEVVGAEEFRRIGKIGRA